MNRDRIIAIGLLLLLISGQVRGADTIETFGVGMFVGLVLGTVLGVAFVYGEWIDKRENDPKC